MSDVKFERLDEAMDIYKGDEVKVTQMGHIIEVLHTTRTPDILAHYTKLDQDHFIIVPPKAEGQIRELEREDLTDERTGEIKPYMVDKNTGEAFEVFKYTHTENRSQNTASIKRTMKKIRNIINANFQGAKNELFITLTYRLNEDKTPQNDIKKASKDFDVFIKRFRRKYPDFEYCAVFEPMENTSWHIHMLIKFTTWKSRSQINIDNNTVIFPMWKNGWTNTKALNNVDNIGAYLSAYFGDVEITDTNKMEILSNVLNNGGSFEVIEKDVTNGDGKKQTKKYLKGARLHLYPTGANIFRCSRGIKKPVPEKMKYSEVKKIVGSKQPDYSKSVMIHNEDKEAIYNIVTYESYNLKRNKPTNK